MGIAVTEPINMDRLFDRGAKSPPLICVEMSGNHGAKLDNALHFARRAKEMGADLLKVQVYTPETITLKSDNPDFRLAADNDWASYGTLYDLYQKAHTPWDWIESIFKLCRKINLPVFASPFDDSAVDFLEDLDCPVYKIASPEITDTGLIEKCAMTGKPVILSTGLADHYDLLRAIEVLDQHSAKRMILKCVSAYPTPIEHINTASIPWIADQFGCVTGLSDHTLGPEAAYAATALGARMIEKHFRLEEDHYSVDAGFSMSLDELPNLKNTIHKIFFAVGEATLDIPEIAKPSLSGRRSLYVSQPIKKGEEFTTENVRSVRPCYGMPPRNLKEIIGHTATEDMRPGDRVAADKIEGWRQSHE